MFLAFSLVAFIATIASAQKCWQDTACTGPSQPSFPGPWEENNFSPSSRTVSPVRVLENSNGHSSKYPGNVRLAGNGSMVTLDFGKEVGGIVTVKYTATGQGLLGLAFTEARNFTGPVSDESNGGSGPDGALYAEINHATYSSGTSSYTMPLDKLRGGFRYLTLFTLTNSTIAVAVKNVELDIAFAPTWPNLRAYGGYFDSNDDLLNRIWYACAYTVQTDTIPPDTGRIWGPPPSGWCNNASLGVNGNTVVVDGAKRDRGVWAGDLGIAIPTILVSTGDFESVKSALQVQYTFQNPTTGELPMVPPPIDFYGSDTYALITLIATHDYVLYSSDLDFLHSVWDGYKHAMAYLTGKIDNSTGLLNVTGASNWGRSVSDAGFSTDGNMLMYGALTTGMKLASWLGEDSNLAAQWNNLAAKLKSAVNSASNNWDPSVGAFKNTATDASIHPEDGNSMGLFFGGVSTDHVAKVSDYLTTLWSPIGAVTPEQPNNIVPFVESFEIKGHLMADQPQRALDLIRRSWGWYLNNPAGTQSTMIEGYRDDYTFNYANDGYDDAGSYPSHSHGWSTGPADALISYVLGLRPTSPGGKTWIFAPQSGDLNDVQGGFTTPLGKFSAKWNRGSKGMTLELDVPENTSGAVRLPNNRNGQAVKLDGRSMHGSTQFTVTGGKHSVTVS